MPEIEIRITGKTGEVDGYLEILLGTMNLAGILRGHELSKIQRDDYKTELYIDAVVRQPPLGHQGEDDIPDRRGK